MKPPGRISRSTAHPHQTVVPSAKTHASRYARIDNAALQDRSLSFRARGLLAYVLSRPKTWHHSAERFSNESIEGETSIRTALNELRAAGYATLTLVRDKNGTILNRWTFRESPGPVKPHSADAAPCTENRDSAPNPDLPRPVKPGSGKPALLETTVGETKDKETSGRETPAPAFSPIVLSTSEIEALAKRERIATATAGVLLETYNADRQTWFHKDGQASAAGFSLWVNKNKHARAIINEHQQAKPSLRNHQTEANASDGPFGWRAVVRRTVDDPTLADGPWSALSRELQVHIARKMKENPPAPASENCPAPEKHHRPVTILHAIGPT